MADPGTQHPLVRGRAPASLRLFAGLVLKTALLLAALLSATIGRALPSDNLRLSEYQKQDWQVEEGLPENNVRMIAQRPDGTLLLATSSGISSFDGQHFRPLDLKDPDFADPGHSFAGSETEAVNAMVSVGNEELWIGTDGSGVLHHTASGTVNISELAGHFHERIRMLCLDSEGVLWIATQNGVERFVHGRLENLTTGGMISGDLTTSFAEDGHGGMFYITSAGLFHWSHGKAQRYPLQLPTPEIPVAIYRDPQKRIWVGTTSHVLELIPKPFSSQTSADASEQRWQQAMRAKIDGPVSSLLSDGQGNLWIGTRREGLWRLNAREVSQWTSRNGMPDDAIRTLFIDDEHNLWIGMLTGGLSRWRKGALAPFGVPEGFAATYSANTLADSHGDLWLGTWGKGLFRRHNGQLIPTSPPGMPIVTPIRALAEDWRGDIWVGTWFDGVYRWNGRGFQHYLLGNESPGNAVSAILPSRDHSLWVGTYTGLIHYPRGRPDPHQSKLLLESQLVTCLAEDPDGSILVGTSMGMYRVVNGVAIALPAFAHSHMLAITIDSTGYVWTAAKGGVLAAIRGNDVHILPANNGLPNVNINSLIEDGDGHLWLGTARGIVRASIEDLHALAEGRRATVSAVILDKADGMRSSECGGPSQPASTRMPDGMLWFVTTKGFVHTTDAAEKLGLYAPIAAITGWSSSIDANNGDFLPIPSGNRISLEAGHSDVLVFFNAKLLANPAHIEFRYRLAGYDTNWTTTRARVARYRRLPHGNYTFEVQARGSGEEWSSPIVSTVIRQEPFLYETWYFLLSLVIVISAVIVLLFRHRVKLMKGRIGIVLEERNRIARECHDTLMAGFAAISWQLEATARLFRDSHAEKTPPAESCELARSMVAHCQAEARRIIWDLRETDEVTNILSHALTRTLSANLTSQEVEASFDIDGDEIPLAPGCVHHLVCIGQEAVTNALRHAGATRIAIQLQYESDALTLSIRDNGCGFAGADQATALNGHFGISVMEERARKLGGTLRLQSTMGVGTEITVRITFNALQKPVSQEHHVIRWIGI